MTRRDVGLDLEITDEELDSDPNESDAASDLWMDIDEIGIHLSNLKGKFNARRIESTTAAHGGRRARR